MTPCSHLQRVAREAVSRCRRGRTRSIRSARLGTRPRRSERVNAPEEETSERLEEAERNDKGRRALLGADVVDIVLGVEGRGGTRPGRRLAAVRRGLLDRGGATGRSRASKRRSLGRGRRLFVLLRHGWRSASGVDEVEKEGEGEEPFSRKLWPTLSIGKDGGEMAQVCRGGSRRGATGGPPGVRAALRLASLAAVSRDPEAVRA